MSFYYGVANLVVRNGELVADFYPYFYVIGSSEPPKLAGVRGVERVDLVPYTFDGLTYRESSGLRAFRVVASSPDQVPRLREEYWRQGFYTSQSNVPYGYRASVDLDGGRVAPNIEEAVSSALSAGVRIVAFDIEVVGDRVYIGATDGADFVFTDDPLDLVSMEADYYVGYNSYSFDFRYLKKVAPTRYVFDTPWGLRPHVDLFVVADSRAATAFGKTEAGSSLYEVALQIGAVPRGLGEQEFMRAKLLRSRLASLTEAEVKQYLRLDVETTYLIGQKWVRLLAALGALLGVSVPSIVQLLAKGTTALMAEVAYHVRLMDLGRLYQERRRERDFEGGDKTKASAPGVYRNVAEMDFSAMYPSTYVSFGVGPDSVRECSGGYPVRAGGEVKRLCFGGGPVWELLKFFYEARRATKKMKERYPEADQAVKILANSAFGGFGRSQGVGIVNEWVAAFIFQYTEYVFESLWEWARGRGYAPLYGDTDSLYVQGGEKILDEVNSFVKRFGELYELKLENVWETFVLFKKKGGGVAEKT
ncbi:MAG: hypothetical protein ACPL3C_06010, partial [Pyrobaculum sp.]